MTLFTSSMKSSYPYPHGDTHHNAKHTLTHSPKPHLMNPTPPNKAQSKRVRPPCSESMVSSCMLRAVMGSSEGYGLRDTLYPKPYTLNSYRTLGADGTARDFGPMFQTARVHLHFRVCCCQESRARLNWSFQRNLR